MQGEDVHDDRSQDSCRLDAHVLVKFSIFDGDSCIFDMPGDLFVGNIFAFNIVVDVVEKDFARAVVDLRRLAHFAFAKSTQVRQLEGRHPKSHQSAEDKADGKAGKKELFNELRAVF